MGNGKRFEWTDDAVMRYWKFSTQNPEEYFTYVFGETIVNKLNSFLLPNQKILDYGCGIGCLIKHLLRKQMVVTATDFSSESVRVVNEKYRNQNRFRGAYTLDDILQKADKFNVIISTEVIEHLDDKKLKEFSDNVKKCLHPGGKVIITTPNNENLEKLQIYCPNCESVFHRWQHVRSWNTESIKLYFEGQGFKTVSILETNFEIKDYKLRIKLKRVINKLLRKETPVELPHLVGVFSVSP